MEKKTHSHKFTEVEHGKKEHTAENLEKKRASEQHYIVSFSRVSSSFL